MIKNTVAGLVLSIGEPFVHRAINSLELQSHRCTDIHLVENITPFFRAMNCGISKIESEFFLQCDADMVPDPDCIAVLLAHMQENVGVSIGHLQDPLMGKIQAIKLFRTSCVKELGFCDALSPDTDLIDRMVANGWAYVFARRNISIPDREDDVFGDHLPIYDELYTFQKFRLEGARMHQRGIFSELANAIETLTKSNHEMAKIAIIGLCNGLFEQRSSDGLSPYKNDELSDKLFKYMQARTDTRHIFSPISN